LRTSEGADEEWNDFETAVGVFDDRCHIHSIGNWYFIQLLAYCFSCVRGTRQQQWWSGLLGQYAHDMVGGAGLITHMCLGHSAKNWESGIFSTHFLKMQILRFHDLIAKIGIAKIGIAKIGIPILAIHPEQDPDFSDPDFSDSHTLLTR
jgi:hypothetical protein